MPTTTNFALRKPVLTDTPDVPRDVGNLGDDTDAVLLTLLPVRQAASATGATLSSGSLGITGGVTVASAAYNRIAVIQWATISTANGTGVVDIEVRRAGTMIQAVRGGFPSIFAAAFTDTIAAGVSPLYQAIATVVTGTGSWTFSSDGRYTWLVVTTWRVP